MDENNRQDKNDGDNKSGWFDGLTTTWWVVGILAILVIFFILWVWG